MLLELVYHFLLWKILRIPHFWQKLVRFFLKTFFLLLHNLNSLLHIFIFLLQHWIILLVLNYFQVIFTSHGLTCDRSRKRWRWSFSKQSVDRCWFFQALLRIVVLIIQINSFFQSFTVVFLEKRHLQNLMDWWSFWWFFVKHLLNQAFQSRRARFMDGRYILSQHFHHKCSSI